MRFLLLIVVFAGISFQGFSDAGKLLIEVRDKMNGEPVAGATLYINGQQFLSNAEGLCRIEQAPGRQLQVTAAGYHTATVQLEPAGERMLIELTPAAGLLNEVVVSATLAPVQRMASPIPVESYSSRFFKKNPTPSLFDAIGMVNGIRNQVTCNVCNTGEIRINGLDGPYTMVLIDGMPIVSSLSTVYGLSGIPNSMIERVEIVKGPASTLYGSEAVAGLINIITVNPLTAHQFSADINGSTMGEWTADFGSSIKLKKANTLIGLNLFNYTNPMDVNNDNFTDITLQRRASLFNKWQFDRSNNLPASFAVRLLAESRWGGEMQWNKSMTGSDAVYGENIDTRRLEWIGQYGIRENLLAEASYNYHYQDSYYGTMHYMGKQHTAFAQLRWNKTIGRQRWLAGIPMRLIHYDDNTPATQKANNTNAPSLQTMAGAFVQHELDVSDKFTTLAGMRYEHTSVQGGVWSPRLALKWQPAAHTVFRLSGGNGFRVVNLFTEDHAALSGFRMVEIADTLKPERSWNINANITKQWVTDKGVFNIDLAGFYTWFSNRIIPDYDTDPQKIIYANLNGTAISRGASLSMDWRNARGWRAGVGATFMDVFVTETDESGQQQQTPQVYAPQWSGTYMFAMPVKKWKATIDLTGTFTGPMRLPVFPDDFRPAYSPWYSLVNVQFTKKFNHMEWYLSGKNLLNFIPQNPIMHPDDPFDEPGGRYWMTDGTPNPVTNPNGFTFDPSYNYAPMQGFRLVVGCRFSLH